MPGFALLIPAVHGIQRCKELGRLGRHGLRAIHGCRHREQVRLVGRSSSFPVVDGVSRPTGMKFDTARCASTLTLSEDNKTASNAKTTWAAVVGDDYLSSGVYDIEIACDSVDNLSLFFGVAAPGYWDAVQKAAVDDEEGDALPRDSPHCICMHGDGRCFIKGKEKDWGLMRVKTGEHVRLTLDFERGLVSFELNRMVRGKNKQTIAEIPGLFASATVVACFGGRDQQLSIASCTERKSLFGSSADGGEGGCCPGR